MNHLFEGVLTGLLLSIIVGPLLMTLINTSIEKGHKAGLIVASGIWTSDLLFILSVYFGFQQISSFFSSALASTSFGLSGGVLLVLFGFILWLRARSLQVESIENPRQKTFFAYFSIGFLTNTVNPFTVFFWIALMSGMVLKHHFSHYDSMMFYGGILLTLIITDSLKVYFSNWLRKYLTPRHIIQVRKFSSLVFIGFGIVVIFRVLFVM